MLKHLKDNHGISPIWPALIIAFIVVIVFFVGLLMIYSDHPMLADITSWFKDLFADINRFFNPTPYNTL